MWWGALLCRGSSLFGLGLCRPQPKLFRHIQHRHRHRRRRFDNPESSIVTCRFCRRGFHGRRLTCPSRHRRFRVLAQLCQGGRRAQVSQPPVPVPPSPSPGGPPTFLTKSRSYFLVWVRLRASSRAFISASNFTANIGLSVGGALAGEIRLRQTPEPEPLACDRDVTFFGQCPRRRRSQRTDRIL